MSDLDLFDAVAIKTGEDTSEIRRRSFLLDDPADADLDHDPDCLFDLIDLPETATVETYSRSWRKTYTPSVSVFQAS